jgi:hypothetical protein
VLHREALQDSVAFHSSRIGLKNSYYFGRAIPVNSISSSRSDNEANDLSR